MKDSKTTNIQAVTLTTKPAQPSFSRPQDNSHNSNFSMNIITNGEGMSSHPDLLPDTKED